MSCLPASLLAYCMRSGEQAKKKANSLCRFAVVFNGVDMSSFMSSVHFLSIHHSYCPFICDTEPQSGVMTTPIFYRKSCVFLMCAVIKCGAVMCLSNGFPRLWLCPVDVCCVAGQASVRRLRSASQLRHETFFSPVMEPVYWLYLPLIHSGAAACADRKKRTKSV